MGGVEDVAFVGTDHPHDVERVSGEQAGVVRLPFHVRFCWQAAGHSATVTVVAPSAQANQKDAESSPFSGATPKTCVPVSVADCQLGMETSSEKAYVSPLWGADRGVGHEARQADPSQEYPSEHSNVHCHGVAERCQFPLTDCEVALEAAFAGTDDQHTSATQDGSEPVPSGTYQESQTAFVQEIEIFENEQVAVVRRTPLSVAFSTSVEDQEGSAGTSYHETSPDSQGAGPPVSAPSTRAHVPLGSSGSRMSPPTDPSIQAG